MHPMVLFHFSDSAVDCMAKALCCYAYAIYTDVLITSRQVAVELDYTVSYEASAET